MKKLLGITLIALFLLSLAACGGNGNSGGRGSQLAFQQMRDNHTGAIVSLGDNISVFHEAFGEGELYSEGGIWFLGQERVRTKLYRFMDGALTATFREDDNTALRFDLVLPLEEAREGRFETFEVALDMHRDDIITLESFMGMQWDLGGSVVRNLSADGVLNSGMIARVGSYTVMITGEDDIAVGIMLTVGRD